MIKKNFKRAASIGVCCVFISSGVAMAMTQNSLPIQEPIKMLAEIDNVLLEKQREIDEYVFETHAKEIEEAGFTVTNTGPVGNYIEVGILPYSEANADHLYKIFGKENIKVVEGIQAVILEYGSGEIYETNIISANDAIGIQVNGEWLQLDVKPFIENDRTLVPFRGVAEKLGAKVEWDQARKAVKVYTDVISIELTVGENIAKVVKNNNGELKEENLTLEVPARIVEDLTFVPARFVMEALGANVEWDNALRAVIVKTEEESDIIGVERAITFESVDHKTIQDSEALSKWYDNNYRTEGFYSLNEGDWMYVLVAAGEKSTGGYSVHVDSITEVTPGTAYVHATLNSPAPDAMVTQAFTYPNVIVRFNKGDIEHIQGDLVNAMQDNDGVIIGDTKESLEEMEKAISIDSVKEMKLYTLMGEELKTFTEDEIKDLVTKLNTSPTYEGPVVKMIAGNTIKIALNDGGSIQLTSFGAEDRFIMAGEVDGEHIYYVIICPEIGSILLDNKEYK